MKKIYYFLLIFTLAGWETTFLNAQTYEWPQTFGGWDYDIG